MLLYPAPKVYIRDTRAEAPDKVVPRSNRQVMLKIQIDRILFNGDTEVNPAGIVIVDLQ